MSSARWRGLAECGTELEPAYRAKVEEALASVEALLGSRDPEKETGDAGKLKAATAVLDEATKPLADMLMDKAMEAMLRKRGAIV